MDHNTTNFDLKWKNIWNLYLINNMKTTLNINVLYSDYL